MAIMEGESRAFFVAGGTMAPDAGSYVRREADDTLAANLIAGKYCFVFNSRQIGKSSLCVRAMRRLREAGVSTAFVDLTKIGTTNITAEQWYAGLANEVGTSLDLRQEFMAYWTGNKRLSPIQRFFGAIREVALEKSPRPLVIFFDEIDATRSLPFSVDELFAATRECYNRRVHDPAFSRLTFCLLGVAVPTDLVDDAHSIPFNVGERIHLQDFTPVEALTLAAGLPGEAEQILARIYYWTNGHPYLTQSLCELIAAQGVVTAEGVDGLVNHELFNPLARETNVNLADVSNRALHAGKSEADPDRFRADMLSAYERAWKGGPLADDESNRVSVALKLSGIMRSEGNRLVIRNRIYEHVFDQAWIRENMPAQEERRQRRAFWLGVLRTSGIAAIVIAAIGWLAATNALLARRNLDLAGSLRIERDTAQYRNYATGMVLISSVWDRHDVSKVRRMLRDASTSPYKGWEWDYWNRIAHLDLWEVNTSETNYSPAISPDGKFVVFTDKGHVCRMDLRSREVKQVAAIAGGAEHFEFFPDGRRVYEWRLLGKCAVLDLDSCVRTELQAPWPSKLFGSVSSDGRQVVAVSDGRIAAWDASGGKRRVLLPNDRITFGALSPDGGVLGVLRATAGEAVDGLAVLTFPSMRPFAEIRVPSNASTFCFSPDHRRVCVQLIDGTLQFWNVAGRNLEWQKIDYPGGFDGAARFSADGNWLITCGVDRETHLYHVHGASASLYRSIPEAESVSLSPNGQLVAVALDQGTGTRIRFIDPETYVESLSVDMPVTAFNPQIPGSDQVTVFDSERNALVRVNAGAGSSVPVKLAGSPAQNEMFSGIGVVTDENQARLIDTSTGRDLLGHLDLSYEGAAVTRLRDGRYLISRFQSPLFEIRDPAAKKRVESHDMGGCAISMSLSPDGRMLAAGMYDGRILLIDVANWHVRELDHQQRNIIRVHFSRDGRYLLAGINADYGEVLDLKTGKTLRLMNHEEAVCDVDLSPNGRRLVTASADGTVRLWDAATGAELAILKGHAGQVWSARFSMDGDSIISVGSDGVRTWSRK